MRRSLLRPLLTRASRPLRKNVLGVRRTPRSRRLSARGVRSAVRVRSRARAGGRVEQQLRRGARRRSARAGLFAPRRTVRGLQCREAGPEAILSMWLVEVDVAGSGVEGSPSRGRKIGAQEFVHAGGSPPVVRTGDELTNDPLHDRTRCELDEAELGRVRRSSGAHGRGRFQAKAGASSASRLTRSGWRRAISSTTRPPRLLPIRWTRSSSSASSRSMHAAAKNDASYAEPIGLLESPKPGRSSAIV